jgi:hypothetical protein
MKIGAFTLETMTDADLENLYLSAQAERIRRADNKRKRTAWIREYHSAFLRHPNATYKVLGETVVVSVYDRYIGIHMGATTPHGEDKFELSTGIAVAFAKAMGERIPDFV